MRPGIAAACASASRTSSTTSSPCAEQLVAEGYTSPQHLAMLGGSNGGLLVGAVMEQRPELFAAALPAVGVLDMLRYDRFTGGRAWVTEYGIVIRCRTTSPS